LKILNCYAYRGRNIYSHKPVVKINIELGEFYDITTNKVEKFNENLIKLLPGLYNHKCSRGYKGGFLERLEEGTYFAHVIEHVAIELQNILGYDVVFGKTMDGDNEKEYCIVYSYFNEYAGVEVGKLAVKLIYSLIKNLDFDLNKELSRLKRNCIKTDLGISTSMLRKEAEKRGIPIIRIGSGSLIQLGYGKNSRRLEATLSDNSSCISVDIACDKELAKKMLHEYGIPVPEGKLVNSEEELLKQCMILGYPVVVKPNFGSHGIGVSINLKTPEEALKAYQIAKEYEDTILVEKYIKGNHYRLLVVGDKMVAASMRIAAHVVGDGELDIKGLIEKENTKNLQRGEGHEKPLTKIIIDKVVMAYLTKQNLGLEYIPGKGETVFLRENDNLSTGGIAIDVTGKVHPDSIAYAVKAAKIVGLDIAGVDITIPDIGKSLIETGGAIIEINAAPGIRMHHFPAEGKPRNVAREIINHLCPKNKEYSIPIISVTGTNGKTTTVRMINHILKGMNKCIGTTTTDGVFINETCIRKGDNTGPVSAETILMDQNVEYAVFETARGGIINKGLGYDMADVGIITNIQEDHLGIDGVYTLEDLAYVKSLVIEAVRDTGYAVLNADDEHCIKLLDRVKSKVILFSVKKDNKHVLNHIKSGGIAFYYDGQSIVLSFKDKEEKIIKVKNIPATLGGILEYNIYNALGAVSAAFALGISTSNIKAGLSTFKSNYEDNPGRFNMYDINGVKIIIDYGHNIDGYKSVLDSLKKLKRNRLIGVIGVPGDRSDSSTIRIGEICGNTFDKIYIKEDKDKRGRKNGEIAEILKKGCLKGGALGSNIIIELIEERAFEMAIKAAEREDIIIVFYEEYEPLLNVVEKMETPIYKTGLIIA